MTREEAIKVLRTESIELGGPAPSVCRFWEALDMAVKALEDDNHFREVAKKVEPLTLDELRQMDGEPVYIVENTEYWSIVNSFDQAGVYLLSYGNPDDYGYFGLYGKTWLAYRQKPEEDDRDERKENENV